MDDMDRVLDSHSGSMVVAHAAETGFDDSEVLAWLKASLDNTHGDANQIDWAAEPRHSRIIAEAIEAQLKSGSITTENTTSSLSALIYVPIMIRVLAGGEALKGERFEWKTDPAGNHYAVSSGGCDWDIGGSEGWWEITVARWDRAEYRSADLERAKLICEQLDAAG